MHAPTKSEQSATLLQLARFRCHRPRQSSRQRDGTRYPIMDPSSRPRRSQASGCGFVASTNLCECCVNDRMGGTGPRLLPGVFGLAVAPFEAILPTAHVAFGVTVLIDDPGQFEHFVRASGHVVMNIAA